MSSGRIIEDAKMGIAKLSNGTQVPVCRFTMVHEHYTRKGLKKKYTRVTLWRNYATIMFPHLKKNRVVDVGGFAVPVPYIKKAQPADAAAGVAATFQEGDELRASMEISDPDYIDFLDLPPQGGETATPTEIMVEGVTIPADEAPFPEA